MPGRPSAEGTRQSYVISPRMTVFTPAYSHIALYVFRYPKQGSNAVELEIPIVRGGCVSDRIPTLIKRANTGLQNDLLMGDKSRIRRDPEFILESSLRLRRVRRDPNHGSQGLRTGGGLDHPTHSQGTILPAWPKHHYRNASVSPLLRQLAIT